MRGISSIPLVAGLCPSDVAWDCADLVPELCSPLHDDGALISSHLDLEPQAGGPDPENTLLPAALELHLAADGDLPPGWADLDPSGAEAKAAVAKHLHLSDTPRGLCTGWVMPISIWPGSGRSLTLGKPLNAPSDQRVAGPSCALPIPRRRFTPGWNNIDRPCLQRFRRQPRRPLGTNQRAMGGDGLCPGQHGVVVESIRSGQDDSRRRFPEWAHELAWLPDSFGFAAGLPAVASATGALVLHPQAGLEC